MKDKKYLVEVDEVLNRLSKEELIKIPEEIRNVIKEHKEVKNIRRVTILKYGSYSSVIIDIELPGSLQIKKLYEIETNIKTKLKTAHKEYKYITINVKPYVKNIKK